MSALPPSALEIRVLPRSLPFLVAALSMVGPFCIDTYLPSFREMEHSLGATELQVQQSLTAFLIPFAFMSLWHGALSDALGRRRVIVAALSTLTAASVGCLFSRSIEMLWAFRVLQGLAAGVFVIGRAVVRDVYQGAEAQRVMSQVSVLFAIAPAVAPILGGHLQEWFGWRSVFVFLSLFTGTLCLLCATFLPETHPPEQRQPLHAGRLLRAYGQTLSHPGFLASGLAGALGFSAVFLYVASAPVLLLRHLHVPATQFIWLFGPITGGLMSGSWISGRLAGRMNVSHTLGWAFGVMLIASAANVLFHIWHAAALPWTVVPLYFYATGIALALPTLTLLGLDYFPEHRGLASSCQAFLLTAANALAAGVLSPFASITPLRLALTSASLMLLSVACAPFAAAGKPGAP